MRLLGRPSTILGLLALAVAGCGDDKKAEEGKGSEYVGDWTGTYSLSGEQSGTDLPFELYNVTVWESEGAVGGTMDSEFIAGEFTGVLDESGAVVGEVENTVDGTTWNAVVDRTKEGISLDLENEASTAEGFATQSPPANKIGYKITVTNTTGKTLNINLLVLLVVFPDYRKVTLAPGESHTYETGLWCNVGWENDDHPGQASFPQTNCKGTISGWAKICCGSSDWEIRPIPYDLDEWGYVTHYKYTLYKL